MCVLVSSEPEIFFCLFFLSRVVLFKVLKNITIHQESKWKKEIELEESQIIFIF